MSPARDLCVLCVQATFLHFNMNVDAPPKKPAGSRHGREGNLREKKLPLRLFCFPGNLMFFLLQTSQLKGSTGQLCSSFPTKTSASRNPLDLTLEEVQQAGWKFPLRIPNGDLEARISQLIAGPPKRKAQRCA